MTTRICPLRTVAPARWSLERAHDVARLAAQLIGREAGAREFDADDWAFARGIFDVPARTVRLENMRRAEVLARYHDTQKFRMVCDALYEAASR